MRILSEDIRLGVLVGVEEGSAFMHENGGVKCGCALGTAGYANGWTRRDWSQRLNDADVETMAALGVRHNISIGVIPFIELYPDYPPSVLGEVSYRHFFHVSTRLELADWLEKEVEPALGLRPKVEEAEVVPA